MMLSCLGTLERVMKDLEEVVEVMMTNKDVQHKLEAQSNKNSSLSRPPGLVCLKLVTQDASGLCFRWSTYGWKANLIRKPIQVVSHQNLFRINRNRRNKSASRICHGAATPSFGPLDHVSSLGPLGARPGVLLDSRVFINSRYPSIRVWILLRLFCQETVSPFIGLWDPSSWD
jgi:hypothetical protein